MEREKTALLIKSVTREVLGFALFCVLFGISTFIRVEIVRLYSSRIGHLTYNFDNYHDVWRLKPGRSRTFVVFVLDSTVANEDVLRRLQGLIPGLYIRGWPSKTARYLVDSRSMAKFLVPFSLLQPEIPRVGLSQRLISLSPHEIQQVAAAAGLDVGGYVCFHNRESRYLELMGGDGNWHSYRDFDFESFQESINFLAKLGVASVRIGVHSLKARVQSDFVDKSGGHHNPGWDLPLVEGAKFFVTGNSGVSHLSTIQRKAHLYVNYLPLRLDHMATFARGSIMLPKTLRNTVTGEFVTLRETIRFFQGWSIHHGSSFFEDSRFEWVDNSPAQILDAVEEMLMGTENRRASPLLSKELNARARELFEGDELKALVFDELGVRFASCFLSQFPELRD